MYAGTQHSTDIQRRNSQRWWGLTGRLAAGLALGLALTSASPGQAKTFHCDAGDVQCLIDAINEANANGHKNTIHLPAGTYTLTTVDNATEGWNGLPSITGEIVLRGAGADVTRLERMFTSVTPCSSSSGALPEPPFRILHVAPTGGLTLAGLTLRGGCVRTVISGGLPQ